MKKIIILLAVAITGCTSQVNTEQGVHENKQEQDKTKTVVQLNNGSKWKADEATKKNVAAMVQVVNDSSYAGAAKRKQLYTNLQTKIDTLVNECRMHGTEHDALDIWLEKVLKDMKELKDEDDEYSEAFAALKKDIESFSTYFE